MGHTYCSGSQEEWNCTYLWRFQGQYKSSFTTLSVFQRQHHTTLQQMDWLYDLSKVSKMHPYVP